MKKMLLTTVLTVSVFLSFSQPKIQFDKTVYDFGNVEQGSGSVSGRFEFTNVGDSALSLTRVKPGCGCTTTGHTTEEVPPGGRGYIDAKYTTLSKVGSFSKSISVTTNEPVNNSLSLQIKGNVVARPLTIFEQTGYTQGEGMVRIKSAKITAEMKNTELRTDTFHIRNFWDKDVEVKLIDLPKSGYLKETSRSFGKEIKTGEEGFIVFLYNATKRGIFGDVSDMVVIQTNDSIEPVKNLFYNVNIREDFSKLKNLDKAPKISVDNALINYEKVKMKESSTKSITITNTGKSKLLIHAIQSPDPNILPATVKNIIEPNKSMTLDIRFNAEKVGKNNGQIKIISNDPTQDVLIINFEAEVTK